MPTKSKSSTIIKIPKTGWNISKKPITVGEILVEEFLSPLQMTQKQLATAIDCDVKTINRLCRGKCSLTAKMAVQLSLYFGNSPEFWLHLQNAYDIWEAKSDLKKAS